MRILDGWEELAAWTESRVADFPMAVGLTVRVAAGIIQKEIKKVYGKPAEQLTEPEWDEVQFNLGQGLRNLSAIYLPDLIVLGGGIGRGRAALCRKYGSGGGA